MRNLLWNHCQFGVLVEKCPSLRQGLDDNWRIVLVALEIRKSALQEIEVSIFVDNKFYVIGLIADTVDSDSERRLIRKATTIC